MANGHNNAAVPKNAPKQWQAAPMKQTFKSQEAKPTKKGTKCNTCGK
jgi:hypothetical protein